MAFRLMLLLSLLASFLLFGLFFLPSYGLIGGYEFFPPAWTVNDYPILPEKTHLVKSAYQTMNIYAIEPTVSFPI